MRYHVEIDSYTFSLMLEGRKRYYISEDSSWGVGDEIVFWWGSKKALYTITLVEHLHLATIISIKLETWAFDGNSEEKPVCTQCHKPIEITCAFGHCKPEET